MKKRMNKTEEQISSFSSNLTATNQRVDTNELSIDENKDSIEAIVESGILIVIKYVCQIEYL